MRRASLHASDKIYVRFIQRDATCVRTACTESSSSAGEVHWSKYEQSNRSVVSDLFQGQMCTEIVCHTCQAPSVTYEPFTTLSMPIPRGGPKNAASSSLVSRQTDLVAMVFTVYRRMPRLSQLMRVMPEGRSDVKESRSELEQLARLYRFCRDPVLVVVHVNRCETTTVDSALQAAIDTYNSNLSDTYRDLRSLDLPPFWSPPPLLSDSVLLVDLTDTDDHHQHQQGDREDNQQHHHQRLPRPRLIDRKESVSSLVGEYAREYCLVLQERNKDVSFISTLQASRLSADYKHYGYHHHEESAGQIDVRSQLREASALLQLDFCFVDALEYDPSHILHSSEAEGALVADLDHAFDRSSYPTSSSFSSSNNSSKAWSSFLKGQQVDKRPASEGALLPDSSESRMWPKRVEHFQVGDRVDAADYKGTWYAGSILDVLQLTGRDLKEAAAAGLSSTYLRFSRDNLRRDEDVVKGINKTVMTAGYYVRVHFDGFSGNWDEWLGQSDLDQGAHRYDDTCMMTCALSLGSSPAITSPHRSML